MRNAMWSRSEYVFPSALLFVLLFGLSLLAQGQDVAQKKYWVYFRDKGPAAVGMHPLQKGAQLYSVARALVSDRALRRRGKVLTSENLIDVSDLPVYQPYVDELGKLGITPHVSSRWLNAISAYLSQQQVSSVASFSFVKDVTPVVTFHGDNEPIEVIPKSLQRQSVEKAGGLDYGPSLEQDSVIKVPAVHSLGINGTGVLIGMVDAGFRWRIHEALKNIHVIAEHDFIFNRDTTANGPNDVPDQDSHGTSTLSVLGGYSPGNLVGVAYGADFMLAKTEYIPVTDYKWEEDNWVEGIEWMEARGVDVVSSSVGYVIFVDSSGAIDSSESYFWSRGDFNGRTAVTTKATVMAARKGVVVVNSMGNEGNTVGSIIAPADADSIISAGAVNYSSVLASFSSVGPTNDGRIKPDVVAPGVSIYVASTAGASAYGHASGTSFSCPLTAGVAALVLSAHPEFTPIQVRDAIRNTASRADRPDNFYGWGVVNARDAVISSGLVFSNLPHLYYNDLTNIVTTYAASNVGVDSWHIRLWYSVDGGKTFSSTPMLPTTTPNLFLDTIPKQQLGTVLHYYVEGQDLAGVHRTSPYNAPDSLFSFRYGEGDTSRITSKPLPEEIRPEVPASFSLYQNFPNPFPTPSYLTTNICIWSPEFSYAEIIIYNVLGERVRTLFSGEIEPGNPPPFVWDGSDDRGKKVASGVYFYQLRTPKFSDIKRMLFVK
jgi:serine protease AprX